MNEIAAGVTKASADKAKKTRAAAAKEAPMLQRLGARTGQCRKRIRSHPCKEESKKYDLREVDNLLQVLNMFPGASFCGSLPCDPWSQANGRTST